ncbi:hypothetical protein [Rubrivirga sp.]|uniref:hypothetical protein n=1 Tax=Rubrivirga sp. TaxID=1885344 RepID=UPI003C7814B2
MRRTRVLLTSLLFLSLAATGCDSSDSGDPTAADVVGAVQVGDTPAQFVRAPFPTGSSGDVPGVTGSDQIVRGGSVILTVDTPDGADRLLIGVEGDYDGYYSAAIPQGSESGRMAGLTTVVLTSAQDNDLNAFTVLVATETDGEVSASSSQTFTVNTQAQASGELQVSLNWDAPVDLDLHLETPSGEVIYFANETGDSGGALDLDSNAACSLDRVDNENITYADGTTPPSGEYIVRVDLWSACATSSPIPFVVTVNRRGSATTFTGVFQPGGADTDDREITRFTM